MRWISMIMLSACLAMAAGCGKKGALYLPDPAPAAKPTAPPAAAPADSKD